MFLMGRSKHVCLVSKEVIVKGVAVVQRKTP